MSNIMNLKHLENKVHKNGFDNSHRNCFTAKVGELLPVSTTFLYPNMKVKFKPSSFTRTIPLNTAAYTRVREYYDFFFVPMRLLWRYSDQFFTQMRDSYGAISPIENGSQPTTLPYIGRRNLLEKLTLLYQMRHSSPDAKDIFDVPRYATISKLAEYLDYGILKPEEYEITDEMAFRPINHAITPFRFLAYQKIYYDYYRMSQWERNEPKFYNIDYVKPDLPTDANLLLNTLTSEKFTAFDLHYVNYNKDLFTGILPSPQYGSESSVLVSGDGSLKSNFSLFNANGSSLANTDNRVLSPNGANGIAGKSLSDGNFTMIDALTKISFSSNIGSLSILALRQGEALQKWKEIAYSGNEDYRTQIKKHFGIDPGPVRSSLCEHIGGFESNIQISEVVNNNLTGDFDADIQGKGMSSGNGYIEFEAKEHGYFMCLYHAKPLLDYAAVGLAPDVTKLHATDFVIPEFDKIGMQTIPYSWLYADLELQSLPSSDTYNYNQSSMGYVPRYAEFKTNVDKVHGAFNRSLNTWVAPWNTDYIKSLVSDSLNLNGRPLDYTFFKVPPFALDSILSVQSTAYPDSNSDHLICCVDFDVDSVQPIDRDGLPY